MEHNRLIYALNDFKVLVIIDSKLIQQLNIRGWLLGNHIYVRYYLFHRLLGYIWLLGSYIVNSSCDTKIVQNCYYKT